jgi:hypothetical protein
MIDAAKRASVIKCTAVMSYYGFGKIIVRLRKRTDQLSATVFNLLQNMLTAAVVQDCRVVTMDFGYATRAVIRGAAFDIPGRFVSRLSPFFIPLHCGKFNLKNFNFPLCSGW